MVCVSRRNCNTKSVDACSVSSYGVIIIGSLIVAYKKLSVHKNDDTKK